jgi:hypothetical protein
LATIHPDGLVELKGPRIDALASVSTGMAMYSPHQGFPCGESLFQLFFVKAIKIKRDSDQFLMGFL